MGHNPVLTRPADLTAGLAEFFSRPLAVPEERVDSIVARLAAIARLSPEAIDAAAGSRPGPVRSAGGTAVIPIVGPIQPRADFFSAYGFTVAIEDLQRAFRAAQADDSVKSIVFDIDSPGGSVEGVAEFADEIFASRGRKPMTAIANGWMASAAYKIGTQADELVVTRSGQVGSIGVILVHADFSRAYDESGITVSVIRTPEHKAEGSPYEPLTAEARDHIAGQLNEYYGMFVDAVARGRGVSATKVRDDFGGGRMVMAREAVRLGMADRIGTIDTVLQRHSGAPGRATRAEDVTQITAEDPSDDTHQTTAPSTEALYALTRSR